MIPCGKCDGCKATHRLNWAIRMYHESEYSDRNCFVTLTYAEAPEKISQHDVQTFMKRLRKASSRNIRYFVTGEYGEKTNRPHYHAVLFGEDFRGGSFDINGELYGNKILDHYWQHGIAAIGDFTMATACYVAGYVNKKAGDHDTFSLMSRNPPIGYRWAVDHQEQIRRTEIITIGGQQYPVPPIYLKWAETTKFRPDVVDLDTVRGNRMLHVKHHTPAELRNKETNMQAKLKTEVKTL